MQLTRESPRGWAPIERQPVDVLRHPRRPYKRLHSRGEHPCRYCSVGTHGVCRGSGCTCTCPTAIALRAAGGVKVDGRKKFDLGILACKGCVQGDHRRCTKLCSCDCRLIKAGFNTAAGYQLAELY